jgi:hypothetical protein
MRFPLALAFLGWLLNFSAWAVNGGMPVAGESDTDWLHHPATSEDRWPLLWDHIPMWGARWSIGDCVIALGVIWTTVLLGMWVVRRYLAVANGSPIGGLAGDERSVDQGG